jgi:hypothetical protein
MTVGDWFLVVVGIGVTGCAAYVFSLEWRNRRRPVRTRDGYRMPRRHPPYRGHLR